MPADPRNEIRPGILDRPDQAQTARGCRCDNPWIERGAESYDPPHCVRCGSDITRPRKERARWN